MPLLLAWGVLGLAVTLAALLLTFLCLLFAHHLRTLRHTRLTDAPGKCELEPLARPPHHRGARSTSSPPGGGLYTRSTSSPPGGGLYTTTLAREHKYTSTLSVTLR